MAAKSAAAAIGDFIVLSPNLNDAGFSGEIEFRFGQAVNGPGPGTTLP